MKLPHPKIIHYAIVCVLTISFIFVYLGNIGKVSVALEQNNGTKPYGEVLQGVEIGEIFNSQYNNISGFSFKLATYMRVNQGYLTIGIREANKNDDIYSTKVNVTNIKDNDFYNLRFPPIKGSKGKKYLIYVKSEDGKPGNAITAYYNDNDGYKDGQMVVNGKNVVGDLVFKVYYNKTLIDYLIHDKV